MKSKHATAIVFLLTSLNIRLAHAHVKWFVEFDVADPPRALEQVFNFNFAVLLLLASVGLFTVYIIDTHWTRNGRLSILDRSFSWHPDIATSIVRIGTGIFLLSLWLIGGVILTPETVTEAAFVPYVQFFCAFFVIFRRTLILSALGIIILYGYGISVYGLFHMLDYFIFLGVAAFLSIAAFGQNRLKQLSLKILYFSLVFTFLWSSIEKFAYAEWFQPFLDANEFLTMGMPRDLFLMCAAFVEFTLVFLLLTGGNVVVLGAVALNALIISAALYFGKIDAIGHLPVIVVLVVLAIKGAERFPIVPRNNGLGVLLRSTYLLGLYWISLALFFATYYGLHWLLYD
jgi:hypothetical protein